MTAAIFAGGTLLKMGNLAGDTFTTVAEVTDLSLPSISADSIDVTSHDSPNRTREFIQGLIDTGEVSFTINYLPQNATHGLASGVLYIMKNGETRSWQLHFTDDDDTVWQFDGFMTQFNGKAPIDGVLSADCTMKVTGFPAEV